MTTNYPSFSAATNTNKTYKSTAMTYTVSQLKLESRTFCYKLQMNHWSNMATGSHFACLDLSTAMPKSIFNLTDAT